MRRVVRTIVFSALLLAVPLAARAQDLGPAVGPLASKISLGISGAWTVLLERGRLVLSDTDDPGAIRFYSLPFQGNRAGGRSVGVRVQATGRGGAMAGLLYNQRDAYPRWAALMLTPDNNVAIVVRNQDGLGEVSRVPIPGGPHAEGELLQISEHGTDTTMLVNGVAVGAFSMLSGGQDVGGGPAGIVAIGPGRFTFQNFAFGQEVLPQVAGDDRVPSGPARGNGGDDRVTPASTGTRAPAEGKRWPVPQLDPLAADILGATMGILAHEIGHFVIGELQVPAVGPEEDVADEFAALVFVDNMRDMPDQASNMALALAKFLWFSALEKGDKNQPPWFDEHAPDRARFGRIMCMLYGAAPRVFEPVMQETGIPERTRGRCIDDERKRHAAWDNLLRSHRRRGIDPNMVGDLDPATPGHRMIVRDEPPSDKRLVDAEQFMQRTHMLDTAADLITKLYVLPRDTQLVTKQCGTVNAFYNPNDGSVTLCDEMVLYIAGVFAKHEGTTGPVAGDAQDKPVPAPASAPQPSAQTPSGSGLDLAQFLAGTWHLVQKDSTTSDDILIQASADGTYRARHDVTLSNNQHVVVGVVGRWAAEAAAARNTFTLTLTPTQWSPTQTCGKAGCQPLDLDPTKATVLLKDRNTLVSDQGVATRVQ